MHRYCRTVAVLLQMLAFLWAALALLLAPQALATPTHIRAELVAESAALPGKTVMLAIHMRPDAGWHGYWRNPGDAGTEMRLEWTLPPGVDAGPPQYPTPQTLLISGLMNHVYGHEYAVLINLKLPDNIQSGTVLPIHLAAQWLACTDKICVPEAGELSTVVRVGVPDKRDPRFDAWRAALPASLQSHANIMISGNKVRISIPLPASASLENPHLFLGEEHVVEYAAPQRFSRKGDLLIAELLRAKYDPVSPNKINAVLRMNDAGDGVSFSAISGSVPTDGTPLAMPGRGLPLPLLLLSALVGGLLLNVMPCVFPILSLKAMSLVRAGESEAQARAEGLAYTAGVVLACLALGALLLGLRAAGQEVGWAFQLQEPLPVALLLLLAVAITINLSGFYEFSIPGFASEGYPRNAFATGLLAAFVATPCTGPFMAAAMGAALLLPAAQALALFGALGLGLALPFLAIALVPALRRLLPRPGPWMERFRKAMAVPMGLTVAALLWLASRLGGSGFALALALLAIILIAALVLLGRRQRHGLAGGWLFRSGIAGILAVAIIGLPGMVREQGAEVESLLPTRPFSEDALTQARSSGKPVFVWFTADWCLTCKVNERVAIEREETARAFEKTGVIVLRGDWTRRDPAITRFLTAQGAAGVPLYLWYPASGGEPTQLPQLLGPDTLPALAGKSESN